MLLMFLMVRMASLLHVLFAVRNLRQFGSPGSYYLLHLTLFLMSLLTCKDLHPAPACPLPLHTHLVPLVLWDQGCVAGHRSVAEVVA